MAGRGVIMTGAEVPGLANCLELAVNAQDPVHIPLLALHYCRRDMPASPPSSTGHLPASSHPEI